MNFLVGIIEEVGDEGMGAEDAFDEEAGEKVGKEALSRAGTGETAKS